MANDGQVYHQEPKPDRCNTQESALENQKYKSELESTVRFQSLGPHYSRVASAEKFGISKNLRAVFPRIRELHTLLRAKNLGPIGSQVWIFDYSVLFFGL